MRSAEHRRAGSLAAASDLLPTLAQHEHEWTRREVLRRVYRDWYAEIGQRLSAVAGETLELGCGISRLKEAVPRVTATDVEPTPWAERVVDAEHVDVRDGTLANLVMIDVFHHLPRPDRFLDEAVRTLAPGGRVVMLEPYCSPLSRLAYGSFHHERLDLDAVPWEHDPLVARSPMDANIALPTLAFFRHRDEYARRWPQLPVVERRLSTLFVYPLSGGFSRRPLLPAWAYRPAAAAEAVLLPLLAPLAAFRCLVVLERRTS